MPQTTEYNFRELIRDTLLKRLFLPQEKFWGKKLNDIAKANASLWGIPSGRHQYGIHYLGKNWKGENEIDSAYYTFLTLAPDHPKLEKELLEVTNELAELENEEYEANRFLSGLVLFPAPVEIFKKVLGRQLFNECQRELIKYSLDMTSYAWDANAQQAIMTYVGHHDYILKAMNQRLLINLITQDHTRQ